jgi:hypothetical protein
MVMALILYIAFSVIEPGATHSAELSMARALELQLAHFHVPHR